MSRQTPTIDVSALTPELLRSAFLLDVREDGEWAAGRAAGALHVPMREVPARVGEIPTDQPVVVICRSGLRSARVTDYLTAVGVPGAVNLDGGMEAWAAAGLPMVGDHGQPYVA